MTLYIKVISGSEIPVADESGLSDPFCVLGLQDRKNEKKTSVKKQTLNPVWNQEFQFKILSYNTDIFYLSLYDYDKYSKNDLLGNSFASITFMFNIIGKVSQFSHFG